MSEIHDLTAVRQAALFRSRELSPVEVTDHYLDRIERLGDAVGAFVTVTPELARRQARDAERRLLSEEPERLPPLLGLCVPVKDLDMVAGVRCTLGSAVFADRVADADEGYVVELRRAGAVLPGKTNTPEFGLSCHTENEVAPPARTPWDTACSAGGSSGGAAAAVAAGLAPLAQGSDGGGSIRIPAAACGLYGIKPTRGRVTTAPLRTDLFGLSVTGPLARTVADAALLLDAITLGDAGDPYPAPPLPRGETFLAHAGRPPARLRLACFASPPLPGVQVHPDVLAAYRDTALLLEKLGHDVTEIEPPFDGSHMRHFATVWAATAAAVPVPAADEHRLQPLTRWLRERGRATPAPDYLEAAAQLRRFARLALTVFAPYDAVLTPTLAVPPVPLGHFTAAADPAEEFARMNAFTPFGNIANITGQPAATLPLHTTADGLPVGVMLTGRIGGEATLLSLSAQLEEARPWLDRRPEIWHR
ncbi:amidase [Thermobifida cellulosilytica]|uniref:Amidase n=1 Tax=Thermobifida cellulosilytica TB100 TaxID=665004 RepID=A0A147KHB1_THECS|nr:amidase [Thermobifida cellulosilytica]KUP96676.1 amidase [Thermobifida cellulosilytica TB100]